jgi:hypothetical protein
MCGNTLNTIDTKSVILKSDENFRKYRIKERKQFKIMYKLYAAGSIFDVITSLVSMDIWGCNRSKVAGACNVTKSDSRTLTSSVAIVTKQHGRYAAVQLLHHSLW